MVETQACLVAFMPSPRAPASVHFFPKRQLMFLYIKLSLYSAVKAHSYVIDMVIIQIEHFFSLLITFQTLV